MGMIRRRYVLPRTSNRRQSVSMTNYGQRPIRASRVRVRRGQRPTRANRANRIKRDSVPYGPTRLTESETDGDSVPHRPTGSTGSDGDSVPGPMGPTESESDGDSVPHGPTGLTGSVSHKGPQGQQSQSQTGKRPTRANRANKVKVRQGQCPISTGPQSASHTLQSAGRTRHLVRPSHTYIRKAGSQLLSIFSLLRQYKRNTRRHRLKLHNRRHG